MKRLRLPKMGKPAPEYRAKHRSPLSHQFPKLRSAPGRHRRQEPTIGPWSESDDYRGRHRKGATPPPPTARHRQTVPGRRLTPADDRDRHYFFRGR